jgi:hypothetical protein
MGIHAGERGYALQGIRGQRKQKCEKGNRRHLSSQRLEECVGGEKEAWKSPDVWAFYSPVTHHGIKTQSNQNTTTFLLFQAGHCGKVLCPKFCACLCLGGSLLDKWFIWGGGTVISLNKASSASRTPYSSWFSMTPKVALISG